MSTKRQTKQVRLESELHKELKLLAVKRGMTISKLLDEIVDKGLGHCKEPNLSSRIASLKEQYEQ